VSFALVRTSRHDLDAFARSMGVHPDLVRRLVALGLLRAERDAGGHLWLDDSQAAEFARVQRLRAVFAVNYTAIALVVDLLDRIAELESALHDRGDQRWTRTS